VLVTGCDSGFGRALTLHLANAGNTVFAGCFTEQGKNDLQKQCADCSGTVHAILLDIRSEKSVEACREFVASKLKDTEGLWGLVNNAGIGSSGPDDWKTTADYEAVLSVNTLGHIRMCHAFVDLLKREQGRIVFTSSVFGLVAGTFLGGYSVSKFAMEAYADTIRRELSMFGVHVALVEPSGFATEIMSVDRICDGIRKQFESLSDHVKTEYGSEYLEKLCEQRRNMLSMGAADLTPVTDCFTHALFAAYPRCRYHPGMGALAFFVPLSYLPAELQDVIMAKLLPRFLPEACKALPRNLATL